MIEDRATRSVKARRIGLFSATPPCDAAYSDHTSTSIVTKMRFFRASLENGGKGGCPLRLPSASSWPAFLATRCGGRESTLEQLISDPIVRAMMDADGVNPHELEAMLRLVAERLRTARRDDEIP